MTLVSFVMSLSYLFQLIGFAPSLIAPVVIILLTSSALSMIVAVTQNTYYLLPYENGTQKYNYVVTALDRMSNESKGTKKKVKL